MFHGEPCVFCDTDASRVVAANTHAFAIRDGYPVSAGHTLIIPRRHLPDWWSTTGAERLAIDALLRECRAALDAELEPDGYNIGINNGAAAGQTVFHLHVHLIPRFDGDVPDPRGGVRHVMPGLGNRTTGASPAEHSAASARHAGPGRPLGAALGDTIGRAEEGIDRADLLVSFVLVSGLLVVEPALEQILDRGGTVRLLTSDYLGVTEKAALERLLLRRNEYAGRLQVRVFRAVGQSFHPKSSLLGRGGDGCRVAFTDSAGISRPGLLDGIEWSVETRDSGALDSMQESFDTLWRSPQSQPLDQSLIDAYQEVPRAAGAEAVGLPQGRGVTVVAGGEPYAFDFMKVYVNVVRRPGSYDNAIGALLRGWFGDEAGAPGTDYRVLLRREGDRWVAEPEIRTADELGRTYGRTP